MNPLYRKGEGGLNLPSHRGQAQWSFHGLSHLLANIDYASHPGE